MAFNYKTFNKHFGSANSDARSNIILDKNTRVSMSHKKPGNNNVLIISGSGVGKSWVVARSNLRPEYPADGPGVSQ